MLQTEYQFNPSPPAGEAERASQPRFWEFWRLFVVRWVGVAVHGSSGHGCFG